MLRLDELLDRRPAALSGGQRQRVAMGRAIVREPKAFLMDEPLSNLDAKLRVSMRAQLASLHARLGATTVYVTHDQVEAMTLGQRVAVMRDGRIQQVDTPQALYRRPSNLFVASFIGSPAMNLVEARFDGESVAFGGFRIPLPPGRRPAVREGDGRARDPAGELRGRGVRRPGPAAARRRGRRARGARLGHARDLPGRRAERVEVEDAARGGGGRGADRRRAVRLQRAGRAQTRARAGARSGSRSIPPASTSSTRETGENLGARRRPGAPGRRARRAVC